MELKFHLSNVRKLIKLQPSGSAVEWRRLNFIAPNKTVHLVGQLNDEVPVINYIYEILNDIWKDPEIQESFKTALVKRDELRKTHLLSFIIIIV